MAARRVVVVCEHVQRRVSGVLTAESLFATSERRVKTYYQLSYYGLFSLAFRVACLTRRPKVHARVDTQDLSSVTTRRCSRSSTMRRSRSACTTLSTPRCGPRGPCSRARCAQVSARPAHLTHTCVCRHATRRSAHPSSLHHPPRYQSQLCLLVLDNFRVSSSPLPRPHEFRFIAPAVRAGLASTALLVGIWAHQNKGGPVFLYDAHKDT